MKNRHLRVLLVDDEPLALRRLTTALSTLSDVEVVGAVRSSARALELVAQLRPDVMLLDIQMAEFDGFHVVERLKGEVPIVIFVTAFHQYATRAFDAGAEDYLLKPVDVGRLHAALDRARTRLAQRDAAAQVEELQDVLRSVRAHNLPALPPKWESEIWAPVLGGHVRVPVEDIEWLRAEGDYVRLHTASKTYLIRDKISSLETRLDPAVFARVHRSIIVNRQKVAHISKRGSTCFSLALACGHSVPVAKRNVNQVRSWLSPRR